MIEPPMLDDKTMATIITTVMCVKNDAYSPAAVDRYWREAMKWIADHRSKQAMSKFPEGSL
jgi:hypothetical protein